MKRNLFFLCILAVLSLLSACWRDDLIPDPTDKRAKRTRLVVSASHWGGTKTTVQDGGTHVLWDTDETIKLFGTQDQAALTSSNAEPAATTDFIGEMLYSQGEKLYGLYPWREDAVCVDDTIITSLPFFQKARAGSFAKDMNLSVAESNSLEMNFMNVCGGVRFTLGHENIYRIVLESNAGETLAGKVWIVFDNGLPEVKKVEEECSRMILNVVGDAVFESGQWYYVVLLPGTVSQGVKLTFYTTDGKYASVESVNALTIERGIFLSKENIDAGVTEWTEVEEESPEIKETNLEVEIPQGTDESFLSDLKLSNFYGSYEFTSNTTFTGVMRQSYNDQIYSRVYDVNYLYSGNGLMMQFLKNSNGQEVMSCIAAPGEKNTISAESTAIRMLMTSPLLITDNYQEYKATVAALKELDEFKELVEQIQVMVNEAMKNGSAPDYTSLDLGPVKRALISKYFQTPDAKQGLDLIDVNRDVENKYISLKIRNHYRRVIHIYGTRAWMSDNNLVPVRTEDATRKLSDVLRDIIQNGEGNAMSEYGGYVPDADEVQSAIDVFNQLDLSAIDIIPFPYVLEPQSASYWKIVSGSVKWWDQDTSTPFEATTDNITYQMKDADKLFLDVYGIGKLENFSQYDQQEKLRIYAVLLHGAYNDFIKPIVSLAIGIEEASTDQEDFHYDLRYGARKAPLQAFFAKLLSNFKAKEQAKMAAYLVQGDLLGAAEYAIEFVTDQVWNNNDPKDLRTYHNLLYNAFKKYIYKPITGSNATSDWFRASLKEVWNSTGLIGATVSISEKALDVVGSVMAAVCSDCKTSFILDYEPEPSVTITAPKQNGFIPNQTIDVAWTMHMGDRIGNVTYDIKVYEGHDGGLMVKSFREIAGNDFSIKLSDLPDIVADEKLKIQVIAHLPNDPSMIYARSELVSVHVAAFQRAGEAIDLGLPSGLLWSSSNLGASTIYDPGDYYAWGELTPNKAEFTWESYAFGPSDALSMYNGDDGLRILLPEHDVVHKTLGGNWRMATDAEWDELRRYCTWEDVRDGDILVGYSVQSNKNKNTIFLPVSGFVDGSEIINPTQVRCWYSSITNGDNLSTARNVNEGCYYNWRATYYYGDARCLGMPVRGVLDNSSKGITPGDIIDLGLTVKWAGANLGASSSEDLGGYYAWGETTPKNKFDWESYAWGANNETSPIRKYNGDDGYKYLLREDDAAYKMWENPAWRTPTIEEWQELQEYCDWTVITLNGRRGYRIKSRINGNSIFLPIYGLMDDEQLRDGMRPRYWSSSITDGDDLGTARNLNETCYYYWNGYADYGDQRRMGMPVRPVYDDPQKRVTLTPGEFVDMGLNVDWASCNMGSSLPEEIGNYYAWGELTPNKASFTWDNYAWGTNEALTKYNGDDALNVLNRDDDAVYAKYGTMHRIPTMGEWEDLWNNCKSELIILNGRRGYLLTSNINNNKIFIPLSGLKDDQQIRDGMRPRYWSSSLTNGDNLATARNLNESCYYNWRAIYYYGDARCLGMPVRAVKAKYEKSITSGEMVDLGLSVKWASCNLGARVPEETGYFFAWGETTQGNNFTWGNYDFSADETGEILTKYNSEDGRRILDWNDDVVYTTKQDNWRMPTIEDWNELRDNCDWTETTLNGVRGFRITSRTNDNSIFLPSAGLLDGRQLRDGMRPRYWSSSLTNGDNLATARNLNEGCYYNWRATYYYGDARYLGMPVRGVYDDSVEKALTPGKTVDMGLSVDWASCNIGSSTPEGFGLYFGWGEKSIHDNYNWNNYAHCDVEEDNVTFTKYNYEDNLVELENLDDAAYMFSAGSLRMPTMDEWRQLMDNTTKQEKVLRGHIGYLLTSTINGNTIFLPFAGFKEGNVLKDLMRPRYWSSSISPEPNRAHNLNETCYSYRWSEYGDFRYLGMPVRGVKD